MPVSWPLALWLADMPRIAGTDLIHPGTGGRPISDMTMAKALRNTGWPDATPHGMRSAFSDWANGAGWSRDLVEDQLAHQIGNAVERAYRRDDASGVTHRHPASSGERVGA
ncbi:tyrosine-type recombinase/integrase [Tateyamaria sp.]|uniref:tyrosine-type recombinase/integrase n=1 Tax=Tateyamaria sp. TaxID=1929288 RepID=UPI00329DA285